MHWPDRNKTHYWNNILDPIDPSGTIIVGGDYLRSAKVYRDMYSHNNYVRDVGNYTPYIFSHPFTKDVTDLYVNTGDVSIEIDGFFNKPNYVYLSVFNDLDWRPIAWSKVGMNKATFTKMALDKIYLPVYYEGYERKIIDYPLWLHFDETVTRFIPNKDSLISLTLNRKYPISTRYFIEHESSLGLVVEASNTPDFSVVDTMARVRKVAYEYGYNLKTNNNQPYRYWRIKPKTPVEISELEFHRNDSILERKSIIASRENTGHKGNSSFYIPNQGDTLQMVFDNDPLTRYKIEDWIGVDMGSAQVVTSVFFSVKNDANYIYPDDMYELLYSDKKGWVSLGIKKAVDYNITYDSVPSNALYWLRNHTTGKDERIFAYYQDRMIFW